MKIMKQENPIAISVFAVFCNNPFVTNNGVINGRIIQCR